MSQLNSSFQETLDTRTTATNKKLDELNKRITDLDLHFENQKKEILKYIDDRGEELTRLLNQFKVCITSLIVIEVILICYHDSTCRTNLMKIED